MSPSPEPAESGKKRPRLAYLDWARGVASLIMIQGHVFHSFTNANLRNTSAYQLSQFVGGMPPAIFLFLTGVTFAFLVDSLEKKQFDTRAKLWAGVRRSGYFFVLAYVFRFQLFLTGQPGAHWQDMLKVDILNAMGLAALPLTLLTIVPGSERVRLAAAMGLLIAAASPIFSALSFAGVPGLIRMYLKPDYNYFSFFPWASFMAFGVAFGSIIRRTAHAYLERLMQWTAMLGFGLIITGRFFGDFGYSLYSQSEFWLDSPALIFIKLGVVLLLLAIAYVWTEYGLGERRSWVALFGMHSLFIYWVHIELVYGQLLWRWKQTLDIGPTAVAAVATIVLMGALTVWKRRLWPVRVRVASS